MDKKENIPSKPSQSKETLPLVPESNFLNESRSQFLTNTQQNNTHLAPIKKRVQKKSSSELDPTTLYLNEIGHTPLLSANEEVKLSREIALGNDDSRKQMIESNLRLVVTLAKRAMNRGLSFLDLIEEGNIGLMRAVEKFNPELGFRFSTYATWWIKQSIDRAIMNNGQTIRMPIHVIKDINTCTRALRKLTEELGRKPSDEELADNMGLPLEKSLK